MKSRVHELDFPYQTILLSGCHRSTLSKRFVRTECGYSQFAFSHFLRCLLCILYLSNPYPPKTLVFVDSLSFVDGKPPHRPRKRALKAKFRWQPGVKLGIFVFGGKDDCDAYSQAVTDSLWPVPRDRVQICAQWVPPLRNPAAAICTQLSTFTPIIENV